MLAQSFLWSRTSLICLWAFLHTRIFFPHTLEPSQFSFVPKFGYGYELFDKGAVLGFNSLKREEFYFGLSKNSKMWKKEEPKKFTPLILWSLQLKVNLAWIHDMAVACSRRLDSGQRRRIEARRTKGGGLPALRAPHYPNAWNRLRGRGPFIQF